MLHKTITLDRRSFVTGLGACSLFTAFGADGASNGGAKKSKLRLASIGCGGMGSPATSSLIDAGCELVAVCDVRPVAFEMWERRYPGIPKFSDYREMLRTMGDKFDAVQIATPDHTHAYIAIDCMLAGKHVYVQKPLARTVEECELMLQTQQKTGVVCQMGNQGHPGVWRYKALRDAAFWGGIKEIYSWSDRPIWPQGMKEFPQAEPLPQGYAKDAWDCWCGPAENRGYSPAYHTFKWRGWWDYGCGAIGDMAVHNADPAFWALQLGLPVKVKGDTCGDGPVTIAFPKRSRIEMWFAPNRWVPNGVKLTWLDGKLLPSEEEVAGLTAYGRELAKQSEEKKAKSAEKKGEAYVANPDPEPQIPGNGLVIVGTKATTLGGSHATRPNCIGGDKNAYEDIIKPAEMKSRGNHYREFVDACLARNPEHCGSKLKYAAPLTEALLIGCISLRYPGEELCFDAGKMRFTNKPDANQWLKAPSRGDWDFGKLMRAHA